MAIKRHFYDVKPKCRTWKLRDTIVKETFTTNVSTKVHEVIPEMATGSVEDIWSTLKSAVLETAKNSCGMTKK